MAYQFHGNVYCNLEALEGKRENYPVVDNEKLIALCKDFQVNLDPTKISLYLKANNFFRGAWRREDV